MFDQSSTGILIRCSEHPWWYSFRFDKIAAYRSSEAHLIEIHDMEPQRAANARRKFETRREARVNATP